MLITIEGISGTGKSYILGQLKHLLQSYPNIEAGNDSFTEIYSGLNNKILSALLYTGDRFFDMGIPLTETMLLLSRLMYQYESMNSKICNKKYIYITDRGLDSVVVAQSIMIHRRYGLSPSSIADNLYSFLSGLIDYPYRTYLLYGNPIYSLKRAEKRDNYQYTHEQFKILEKVEREFTHQALQQPERFVMLNIDRLSGADIISVIKDDIIRIYNEVVNI